jgi:hypothetical protein
MQSRTSPASRLGPAQSLFTVKCHASEPSIGNSPHKVEDITHASEYLFGVIKKKIPSEKKDFTFFFFSQKHSWFLSGSISTPGRFTLISCPAHLFPALELALTLELVYQPRTCRHLVEHGHSPCCS